MMETNDNEIREKLEEYLKQEVGFRFNVVFSFLGTSRVSGYFNMLCFHISLSFKQCLNAVEVLPLPLQY